MDRLLALRPSQAPKAKRSTPRTKACGLPVGVEDDLKLDDDQGVNDETFFKVKGKGPRGENRRLQERKVRFCEGCRDELAAGMPALR